MGFGGISIWSLVLILGIVILLFGTKKLRNVGGDLGSAIKNFKKSVKEEEAVDDKSDNASGGGHRRQGNRGQGQGFLK